MDFKNPLTGSYEKINMAFMHERANRRNDPRHKFYEAILSNNSFSQYYSEVGDLVVRPTTTSYDVNADMEIKYALRRGWIEAI